MLITPIDIAFVLVGLLGVGAGVFRRWTVPAPESPPPVSRLELFLAGLACIPAAVGPNVLVVALTPGMPEMPVLVRWALLPSVGLLALAWVLAVRLRLTRLSNRIWTGLWVGFVCTAALDVPRLIHFHLGLLPGNMPRMFGVLILDQMASGPTLLSDIVGGFYHYWVSACFGLTYTLLVGRTRWWGGLIWGLIIEVGMMITPPMVVAMGTGYFGLNLGQGPSQWGLRRESLPPHCLRHRVRAAAGALYPASRLSPQIDQGCLDARGWVRAIAGPRAGDEAIKMSTDLSAAPAEALTVVPDKELVVRAQAGDTRAFDELVRRHYDKVYRLARYLCDGQPEDAEDTFQNALMKAYQHLAAFRGESQFSTWLTRIAVNECLLHRRRQRRERHWVHLDEDAKREETSTPVEVADSSDSSEEEYARGEFEAILQRCLRSLPDLSRTAFVLRQIDGVSNQEIARRLGFSLPGIKSRLMRARRQIRRCLQKSFCRNKRCYWPASGLVHLSKR